MSPRSILLFSGKRKSGKDFITDHLKKRLGDKCEIIKISQPIKSHWAKEKDLNLDQLLGDSEYKEQHRLDMIKWSEAIRAKDHGYFCQLACQSAADKPIWIVSDIRRKTDILWFKKHHGDTIKNVRIVANEDTRVKRGFHFKSGVDDAESECDLDDYVDWDLVIDNSISDTDFEDHLKSVILLLPSL